MTTQQTSKDLSPLCQTCPIAQRVGECRAVHPKYHAQNPLKYLFVGEAPGKDEDAGVTMPGSPQRVRQPFVGPAGTLLRAQIAKAKIDINDCLFTNSAWCAPRPSATGEIKTPKLEEADHCLPHSLNLIRQYRPEMVIAAGKVALDALSGVQTEPPSMGKNGKLKKGKKIGITKLRGKQFKLAPSLSSRHKVFLIWAQEAGYGVPAPPTAREVVNEKTGEPEMVPYTSDEILEMEIEAGKAAGYDESWLDIPVLSVVHPSYALRTGMEGHWAETIALDLEEAAHIVEGIEVEQEKANYRWINDVDDWKAYVDETLQLYAEGKIHIVAGDLETSEEKNEKDIVGLMPFDPRVRIITIQFSRFLAEGVNVMVNHKSSVFNDPATFQMFRHHLKRLFDAVPMVFHNAVFDVHTLRCRLGIWPTIVADTMLMEHWHVAGTKLSNGLDEMGARYCGSLRHKNPANRWRDLNPGLPYEEMPLDIALGYGCGDTDITLRCYYHIRHELEKQGRWEGYYELHHGYHKSWNVICDMEHWGMPCRRDVLDFLATEYPRRIEECSRRVHDHPLVKAFIEQKRLAYNEEALARNAEIDRQKINKEKGYRRRKWSPIENLADWVADPKNRLNLDSWMQIHEFWEPLLRTKNDDGSDRVSPFQRMEDIAYNDECPTCGRDGHKCKCRGQKYIPKLPSTNEHNRTVMQRYFRRWQEGAEAHGDATSAGIWGMWADYIDLHNEFKMLTKMYGTYVKGIYNVIIDKAEDGPDYDPKKRCFPLYAPYCDWPEPWVVHASYLMHGTETGRLSSANPNGQNFPKRKMDKKANVKAPYVSRYQGRGGLIIQPDYSQIEVRVMVILAGDENMMRAINEGKDIHVFNAAMVHGIPEDKVTKDLRGPIKTTTFGIIYGQSVQEMAANLGMSVQECQAIQDAFFAACPRLKALIEYMHEFAKENGYVETLFGRRRYLPLLNSHLQGERDKALRQAVNTPIQSAASDLCWSAFGRSWAQIQEIGINARPYALIHDSQGFDVGPGDFFDVIELQYYQMVYKPYELWNWVHCKPESDFEIGAGWGDLVEAKLFWDENEELDHNRLALSGSQDTIDAICAEITAGGQALTLEEDGPHPKEEEAEKGMWYRKIYVDRPNPKCLLRNKQLEILT